MATSQFSILLAVAALTLLCTYSFVPHSFSILEHLTNKPHYSELRSTLINLHSLRVPSPSIPLLIILPPLFSTSSFPNHNSDGITPYSLITQSPLALNSISLTSDHQLDWALPSLSIINLNEAIPATLHTCYTLPLSLPQS